MLLDDPFLSVAETSQAAGNRQVDSDDILESSIKQERLWRDAEMSRDRCKNVNTRFADKDSEKSGETVLMSFCENGDSQEDVLSDATSNLSYSIVTKTFATGNNNQQVASTSLHDNQMERSYC